MSGTDRVKVLWTSRFLNALVPCVLLVLLLDSKVDECEMYALNND